MTEAMICVVFAYESTNLCTPCVSTIGGDEVSMLTHSNPHKPLRKIKVMKCNYPGLVARFMCGLMSDLVIASLEKYGRM